MTANFLRVPLFARLAQLRKLMRLLARPVYRRALRDGTAAAIEHETAVRDLALDTVIDIGANIGQFSVVVKAFHPAARIHAFEPMPDAVNRLRRTMRRFGDVTIYAIAAGRAKGMQTMHVSGRSDSSSLMAISALQENAFPGTGQTSQLEIEVDRVDNILDSSALVGVVLVKLDVQGFEIEALEGLRGLFPFIQYIYCEVSFVELYEGQPLADEVIAWLSDAGFNLRLVSTLNRQSDGRAFQCDILFEHRAARG